MTEQTTNRLMIFAVLIQAVLLLFFAVTKSEAGEHECKNHISMMSQLALHGDAVYSQMSVVAKARSMQMARSGDDATIKDVKKLLITWPEYEHAMQLFGKMNLLAAAYAKCKETAKTEEVWAPGES